MINNELIWAARRQAQAIAEASLVDEVRITRDGAVIYQGAARLVRNSGRPEVTESQIFGTTVFQFAEMQIPNDAPACTRADLVTVTASIVPALVNRQGRVAAADPVETWSAIQKILVKLDGQLVIN